MNTTRKLVDVDHIPVTEWLRKAPKGGVMK